MAHVAVLGRRFGVSQVRLNLKVIMGNPSKLKPWPMGVTYPNPPRRASAFWSIIKIEQ